MNSFKEVWEKALVQIREKVSDASYTSWISTLTPVKFESDKAYLYTPTLFQKGIVEKFRREINTSLTDVMGFDVEMVLVTDDDVEQRTGVQATKKEDDEPPVHEAVDKLSNSFNSDLTFDNFVVGNENKFAHAAALAVANNPAGAYNPFFIYGKSGLGKTHLLFAIANEIKKTNPKAAIVLVKGEDFTNELIQSIQKGEQDKFRNKYRFVDVFLMDDVQFIGGKPSTELEFFHTFESLYESGKQIIVTSDRPPKEMATLEERLKTRFESGLIADIQPPEYETRVAIIKKKANALKLELSEDTIDYLASKLKNNVRELEGAVKKIKAYSLIFFGQPPTIGILQNVIQSVIKENINTEITIDKIVDHVSKYYNVSVEDIYSNKRPANILLARQVSMYIARELTDESLSLIGEKFNKNHTTVLYSVEQIRSKADSDSKFSQLLTEMRENIKKEF